MEFPSRNDESCAAIEPMRRGAWAGSKAACMEHVEWVFTNTDMPYKLNCIVGR